MLMKNLLFIAAVLAFSLCASAAWYWPFGDDEEKAEPRLSELMSKASEHIDEAEALADEGKVNEAVAEYRKALDELHKVEIENPERAMTPEFSSLKNKRALISTAITTLLMNEARSNAKAVAVTDTTNLEMKYSNLGKKSEPTSDIKSVVKPNPEYKKVNVAEPTLDDKERYLLNELKSKSDDRALNMRLAGIKFQKNDLDAAFAILDKILKNDPSNAAALNLKAAVESKRGDFKAAEATLYRAITNNSRSYYAYYNMARLMHQIGKDKNVVRRYYETGRTVGGPKDDSIEELLK